MSRSLLLGLSVCIALTVPSLLYSQPDSERLIKTLLKSDTLQQQRALAIHLPLEYDSTKQYPVLYALDGLSQSKHITEKFDSLSALGLVPQVIVVGIPNMSAENRQRQLIPPYMKIDYEKPGSPTGDADKFLSFMEHELFPFLEKNYSASNVRLFAGNSRGGLLVMHSLVYKPEMFQARFCFSTPFWREDNVIVSKVSDVLSSLAGQRLFLYMSAGAQETDNIKSGLSAISSALKEGAPEGLRWHAEYTPDSDHQNNAQNSAANGIAKWGAFLKQ